MKNYCFKCHSNTFYDPYISFPLKVQVHDLQVQLALAFGPSDIKDEVIEPADGAEPVGVAESSGSKGGPKDKKQRVLSRRDLWLHSPSHPCTLDRIVVIILYQVQEI